MTKPIDVDPVTPYEAQTHYPALWATYARALPEATPEQLAACVSIHLGVCTGCYEAPRGCRCSWDE